jgi:hypothetical protein
MCYMRLPATCRDGARPLNLLLAYVLFGLVAWALLSGVCGIVVGRMIDIMQGPDEFRDPRGLGRDPRRC